MQDTHSCCPPTFSLAPQWPPTFLFPESPLLLIPSRKKISIRFSKQSSGIFMKPSLFGSIFAKFVWSNNSLTVVDSVENRSLLQLQFILTEWHWPLIFLSFRAAYIFFFSLSEGLYQCSATSFHSRHTQQRSKSCGTPRPLIQTIHFMNYFE